MDNQQINTDSIDDNKKSVVWKIIIVILVVIILFSLGLYFYLNKLGGEVTLKMSEIRDNETAGTEIADNDGWVGIDNCITVDAGDRPHISHYDQADRNLKYSTKIDGRWESETVDEEGDVGESSGIAIDADGYLHISYVDATNGGVKYATKSKGAWSSIVVDTAEGMSVKATSIAIDEDGGIHIGYVVPAEDSGDEVCTEINCSDDGSGVKYAYFDGNSWQTEEVSSDGADIDLTVDSSGNPSLIFRLDSDSNKEQIDNTGVLTYATKNSGSWQTESVDENSLAGGLISLAIDSNDVPYVAYKVYSEKSIKYAERQDGVWSPMTVAENIGASEGHDIAVDSKGNPRVTYSDENQESLILATFDGNDWALTKVDRMGINSIAIDSQNRAHISYTQSKDDVGNKFPDLDQGDNKLDEIEILKYVVK